MQIGQVAAHAGVSVQTVRLYERLGLIAHPVRRPSGYREYPATVVQRIQAIKRGTLDPQWPGWFDVLTITDDAEGNTLPVVSLADQAGLYGVISRMRDLGLTLLAVVRLPAPTDSPD